MKKTFLAIFIAIMVACHSQDNSMIQFLNAGNSSLVPFELYNNLIFLKCSVNGSEPGWFVFDTGSGITLLDSTFAVDNNIDISDSIIAKVSGTKVPAGRDLDFVIKDARLSGVNARIMNTFMLSSVAGRKMDGIIGYDFLRKFVVEINYETRTLCFSSPAGFEYKGNGQKMPVAINRTNWPLVDVKLTHGNKITEGKILFDTGSLMALSLNSDELAEETIPYPVSFGIGGAGGGSRMGRISSFQVGKYHVKNVLAGFPEKDASTTDNLARIVAESGIGLVGGEVLKKFTMTFDYSRMVLYIEPNNDIDEPCEFDMSGLTIITVDDAFQTFMIIAVTRGSPADFAGLLQGDIILEIDGKPALDHTLAEIRGMFKNENRSFILKLRRGEEIVVKEFSTKKMI